MIEILLIFAVIILLAVFSPGFLRQGLRPALTVAVLASLASAGRVLMAAIPSVQPSSFLIMMAGIMFGPGGGLLCGVLVALLSNLVLGLGPYMPWQLFLWGAMGLTAGFLRKIPFWAHAGIGFAWGFIFGWGMNLWYYSLGLVPFSIGAFVSACVMSFPMDIAHAITNMALMAALAVPIMALHRRFSLYLPKT